MVTLLLYKIKCKEQKIHYLSHFKMKIIFLGLIAVLGAVPSSCLPTPCGSRCSSFNPYSDPCSPCSPCYNPPAPLAIPLPSCSYNKPCNLIPPLTYSPCCEPKPHCVPYYAKPICYSGYSRFY